MKRTISILLLIVVFIYPLGLQAAGELDQEENEAQQTASGEDETREKKDSLIKNWASDHGRIWTSPTRIKGTQWLIWGGVILATGVMIANDEAIYRSIKDFQEEHGWVDDASPVFSKLAEDLRACPIDFLH